MRQDVDLLPMSGWETLKNCRGNVLACGPGDTLLKKFKLGKLSLPSPTFPITERIDSGSALISQDERLGVFLVANWVPRRHY